MYLYYNMATADTTKFMSSQRQFILDTARAFLDSISILESDSEPSLKVGHQPKSCLIEIERWPQPDFAALFPLLRGM